MSRELVVTRGRYFQFVTGGYVTICSRVLKIGCDGGGDGFGVSNMVTVLVNLLLYVRRGNVRRCGPIRCLSTVWRKGVYLEDWGA